MKGDHLMRWLTNIKMETGYDFSKESNVRTKTEYAAIGMEDGVIRAIEKNAVPKEGETVIDGRGYLLLPAFADNHIHLDKGHYGGPWQAVVPVANGVQDRIREEEGFLLNFLEHTPEKAQALIDLVAGNGATFLKVQVNVDPVAGLKNLECVYDVLKNNSHRLEYEIVVFPQHGTLATEAKGWLTEAMKHPAVTAIGGLDPATIDGDIEASLKTIFDLAAAYEKHIDIHLHDGGTLGMFEMHRIVDYTEKYQMEGKVQISHGFCLADHSEEDIIRIAQRLSKAGIAINSAVPLDGAPNLPLLRRNGVTVHVVNDNINDHWSPFGTGDLLQRASRAAEKFDQVDERSLAQCLSMVTRGVAPLSREGELLWPKPGDPADFVLVPAESAAHAVARVPQERIVIFKGEVVSQK